MEWKTIAELPKPEDRVSGFYFIKQIGVDEIEMARYAISLGIYGWWTCGEEYACYDEDIELVYGPIEQPELPK